MFQTKQTFIEIENVLYKILKVISESQNPTIDVWKEHLRADRVFKKEGSYFFVEVVPEAILDESNDEQIRYDTDLKNTTDEHLPADSN